MESHTYSEEEFKQVLKNLFVEKKKVKELQKQLDEKVIQKKFLTQQEDVHKLFLTEEYAKLQTAYYEKEKEGEYYRRQLDKVRPALKKLVDDLKSAHLEIETLKSTSALQSEYQQNYEELVKKILVLEEQKRSLEMDRSEAERKKEEEMALIQKTVKHFEAEHALFLERNHHLEGGQKLFDEKIKALVQRLEETYGELEKFKISEKKEIHYFEIERNRLVEKLAEALSHMQKKTDMIKNLREEVLQMRGKVEALEAEKNRLERKNYGL